MVVSISIFRVRIALLNKVLSSTDELSNAPHISLLLGVNIIGTAADQIFPTCDLHLIGKIVTEYISVLCIHYFY